jgi:hypothetical protein
VCRYGAAGMTFFLPSLFALALLPPGELGWLERVWCHVNFWIGICIAVAGVWTSVMDLTEARLQALVCLSPHFFQKGCS